MLKTRITLFSLFLLWTFTASAAMVTWVGGNGDWDDPSMWDSGAVPTAADEVVLANGSVAMYSNASVRALSVTFSATFYLAASAQLTVLPTAAIDIPLSVYGKVHVEGRVRVLNQLGYTDDVYLQMSGRSSWQTDPGGEVLLDGGSLKLTSSQAKFNNRGYLQINKTSYDFFRALSIGGIFLNGRTGLTEVTVNLSNSYTSTVVFISLSGQLVNHGVLRIETEGNEEIKNDNRLDNWGELILNGLYLRNGANGTLTNRQNAQIRLQHNAPWGFNLLNETNAHVVNHGLIDISNATASSGLLNSGRFDNYRTGHVRLDGDYPYHQLRNEMTGEWYNYGRLSCGGGNSSDHIAIWNNGNFQNLSGGRVGIHGSHQEGALKNTSYFLNEGYLSANDVLDNQNVMENANCGEILARADLTNAVSGVWLNDGWLRLSGNGAFTNNGYFQHTGLIEDPDNNINPNDIVNDGVIAQTYTQPLFIGDNPDFLVLGEWWQVVTNGAIYQEPEGDQIGHYDANRNIFTAWRQAEGLQEVYFLTAPNNGSCETWFVVNIPGGIMESPRPFQTEGSSPISTSNLRLYPNPTTDFARLSVTDWAGTTTFHWSLFNPQGQLLNQGVLSDKTSMQLDLTPFPPGIYSLRLQDAEGHFIASQRLIKQ